MLYLIIGGSLALILLAAGSFAAYRNYIYNRPKTRGATLILSGTGALVVLVVVGSIVANALTPQDCSPPPLSGQFNCVTGNIAIDGSTALKNLVSDVANDYIGKCPSAQIDVNPGVNNSSSSADGLREVENGEINIGDSDISATEAASAFLSTKDLVDHQVAVVIFAVIIHGVSNVNNLSTDELRKIYDGTYTNWSQVGGPNLTITPFIRKSNSGTRATFDKYILGPGAIEKIPDNRQEDKTDDMINAVSSTPGAIGYASYSDALNKGLTIVNIDGHIPSRDLVINNTYKFWTIEHMYTKSEPSGLTRAFLDYMGSSFAKNAINAASFVLLSDMSVSALESRC